MKKIFLFLIILLIAGCKTKDNSAKLIIIRHGQGTHNVEGFYSSDPNHPNYRPAYLTEKGMHQARRTAFRLSAQGISKENIQEVYVSPLPRTIQTANYLVEEGIISPDQIKIEPRLIEVQMGEREGKHYYEFPEDPWDHSKAHEYGGETNQDVRNRVISLYNEVISNHPKKNIIFVTHGSPALELTKAIEGNAKKLNPAEYKILQLTKGK